MSFRAFVLLCLLRFLSPTFVSDLHNPLLSFSPRSPHRPATASKESLRGGDARSKQKKAQQGTDEDALFDVGRCPWLVTLSPSGCFFSAVSCTDEDEAQVDTTDGGEGTGREERREEGEEDDPGCDRADDCYQQKIRLEGGVGLQDKPTPPSHQGARESSPGESELIRNKDGEEGGNATSQAKQEGKASASRDSRSYNEQTPDDGSLPPGHVGRLSAASRRQCSESHLHCSLDLNPSAFPSFVSSSAPTFRVSGAPVLLAEDEPAPENGERLKVCQICAGLCTHQCVRYLFRVEGDSSRSPLYAVVDVLLPRRYPAEPPYVCVGLSHAVPRTVVQKLERDLQAEYESAR